MRVLPNQGPTLQLVAYQNLSDFWSCVHASIFLLQQRLTWLSPVMMAIPLSATDADLPEPRKLCSAKWI
jgi:hypothetical protein